MVRGVKDTLDISKGTFFHIDCSGVVMTNKSVALDKLRQDIDTIDNQLVRLLTDRMNIALNIADMKANSVDEVLPVTESK